MQMDVRHRAVEGKPISVSIETFSTESETRTDELHCRMVSLADEVSDLSTNLDPANYSLIDDRLSECRSCLAELRELHPPL